MIGNRQLVNPLALADSLEILQADQGIFGITRVAVELDFDSHRMSTCVVIGRVDRLSCHD